MAFANTKGGFVYIGITDNGNIQGVNLSKESIQNWINEIKHKTQPSLIPDVEEIIENNKTIVVLKT